MIAAASSALSPLQRPSAQRGRRIAAAPAAAMASRPAVAAVAAPLPPTLPRQQEVQPATPPRTTTGGGSSEDPWKDPRWAGKKWTVYRGVAYDLTAFMDRHPAGASLLRLAIGRDCTALFESYHLRPEVAVARLQRLPRLEDFPVDAVPRSPYPNDSPIYNAIRDRVRNELFGGQEHGAHRTGSEGAAAVILGYAAASYLLYAAAPGPLSGFLLGLGGAWIGLTVQHCGNHGAMSTKEWVNDALGLCDDLIGGSSLTWRYHHQVSHHIHCNDEALDEDVLSSFPLLRFDARLPRHWYHRYQHIYMWATFPLLQLVFQVGDWQALLANRTAGATMYGVTTAERATVVLGKLAHYGLLLGLPWALHGGEPALWGAAAYAVTQSIVLASTFAVSHNVPESKPTGEGPTTDNLLTELAERDWGMQQILTSADWGGVVGNFFTGGLNLQVEHHLFPAISFCHYPAIAEIVKDECAKRGVPYARYDTLPEILGRFVLYMKEVGVAEQLPSSPSMRSADLARL